MTIDHKIRYGKLQYDINRKAPKTRQEKLINMNFLQLKKYYLVIENK